MESPKLNKPYDVSQSILNPTGKPQLYTLTLTQFKIVYQEIYKDRGNTRVDIVLNGNWALAQFSELCNHRIRVLPDNLYSKVAKFFNYHLYLEKKDFEIVYSSAIFYGQEEYLHVGRFFKEEIQVNGLRIILLLVLSGIFLTSINSIEGIKAANELLIGVASIFFSIFLLFTVSQNLPSLTLSQFKTGLTHRFIQIDSKITYLVICVIGLAFVNLVLVNMQNIIQKWIYILNWSTALGISLISTVFFTVVQYYFARAKNLYETDMSKEILDDAFQD